MGGITNSGHIKEEKTLELLEVIRNNLKYVIPCLKYLGQLCAKCSFESHHLFNGNFHLLVIISPAGTTGNKFAPQDLLCLFLDIFVLKMKISNFFSHSSRDTSSRAKNWLMSYNIYTRQHNM